jgi:hypothetical protein
LTTTTDCAEEHRLAAGDPHAATPAEPRGSHFPRARQDDPPTSWSRKAKDEWQALPAVVRAAVTKREQEVAKGFAVHADRVADLELARKVHAACAPVAEEMQTRGVDAADVISEFVHAHKLLEGPNAVPVIEQLIRRFAIPAALYPYPKEYYK